MMGEETHNSPMIVFCLDRMFGIGFVQYVIMIFTHSSVFGILFFVFNWMQVGISTQEEHHYGRCGRCETKTKVNVQTKWELL